MVRDFIHAATKIYKQREIYPEVLEAVEKAILLLGGKSIFMAWIDYIFAPVITLMILISAAWIIRKWMPLVWKALSGGRK